jgi:hypothetical protein
VIKNINRNTSYWIYRPSKKQKKQPTTTGSFSVFSLYTIFKISLHNGFYQNKKASDTKYLMPFSILEHVQALSLQSFTL